MRAAGAGSCARHDETATSELFHESPTHPHGLKARGTEQVHAAPQTAYDTRWQPRRFNGACAASGGRAGQ